VTVRRFLLFLVIAPAVLVAVIVVGIAAGGTGGGTAVQAPQLQTMVISAGGEHSPSSFAVRPGVPVQLTIVNRDAQAHVFSIPELGVNQIVPPARNGVAARAVVTFTAPYGVYEWHCALCPDEHGSVYALVTGRTPGGAPPGGFHWTQA
jgi:heme/copper-type cytochrome/quinol oxidase subunit 2